MLVKTILTMICACLILASCTKVAHSFTDIETFKVESVWNKSPFNAFTDLIFYDSMYYCAFREAETHVSYDGKIRVIVSRDGNTWNNFSVLEEDKKDLRDPHFYIDNKGFLCIGTNARKTDDSRQSLIFKLKQPCYSMGGVNNKLKISLFNNKDVRCIGFKDIITNNWITDSFACPSEASIIFTPDSNLISIVRDQDILGYSHIGISKYPFNKWEWKKFPYYIRGPKLALLPDGKLFLSGASLIDLHKTYYVILNPKKDFAIETIKTLPSDGDSGYPGVIVEGSSVLLSYYS